MNEIALDFGFIQIYWYSIFILLAMSVGMFIVLRESKKKRIHENAITDLVFWTVVWGVVGARLYYVLFNLDYYGVHQAEIFELWKGGLAIHGGIMFGLFYVLYFCRKRNFKLLKITDICAPGLIIGQAIGRWGNFFNREAYGVCIGKAALEKMPLPKFIVEGMYIPREGDYCQPTFLYESIWNLVGFIILLFLRRIKYIKEGQITGFYLVWYSAGRFVIEGMRMDSLRIGGPNGLRVAQLVSIILGGIGLFLIWFRFRKPKFEYLYNAEDNEITRTESK